MADLTLWFVRIQGEVRGPVGGNTLKSWATEGTLGPGDEVSQSASGPWHQASKVRGLFSTERDALKASKIAAKTAGPHTEATPPNPNSVSDPTSTEASPKKRKNSSKKAQSTPLTPADNRLFWAITIGVLSWFFVVPLTGLRGTWLYSTLAAAAIGYATSFFSNRKGEPPAWIGVGIAVCSLLTVGGWLFGWTGRSGATASATRVATTNVEVSDRFRTKFQDLYDRVKVDISRIESLKGSELPKLAEGLRNEAALLPQAPDPLGSIGLKLRQSATDLASVAEYFVTQVKAETALKSYGENQQVRAVVETCKREIPLFLENARKYLKEVESDPLFNKIMK
jgi:hypothetical protein